MDEDCLKLTTYLAERRRTGDGFVSDLLLGLYERHRIASSVVLRGIGGFGTGRHYRTDESLSLSEDPPVAIVAVDTRTKIEALLEPVLAIKQRGLVTLERARLLRGDIGPLQLPEELHEAVKLTIYVGRKERVDGVPAHVAICDLMYRRQLAGASVFLGVDGTLHGHRQRARFFGRNADVPVMIIAVGSGDRIGRVLPELGALLPRPMITLERVRVCKRDGELLERPHALARGRRARPAAMAEVDGLHLRIGALRRRADSPRAGPAAAAAQSDPTVRPCYAASGAFTAIIGPTATRCFP